MTATAAEASPAGADAPGAGSGDLALVMSGGGARAAYQVGLLRCLARRVPGFRAPILTGVSAGAINAAHLASSPGGFAEKAEELASFWSRLSVEQVFDVQAWRLCANTLKWGLRLVSGGRHITSPLRGLVGIEPLRRLLEAGLPTQAGRLVGIQENLEHGNLRAVAITATSYTTGQSVTWVQGSRIEDWERPLRRGVQTSLALDHVLASASLPLFFPAVPVEDEWFGDGGIRQAAPLSPAVHLGARKILAISTRYRRSTSEAAEPEISGYPPLAQVGVLLNSIFLDMLDSDALRMERINHLLEAAPGSHGLRPVRLLVMRPSRDLGRLANEYEPRLPWAFRFLTRGLGTRETRSNDLLSLVMFQGDYLQRLIALGEADAEERLAEIQAFLAA